MNVLVNHHKFVWHHEYVTVDPLGDVTTKKFHRSRLGLMKKIDEVHIEMDPEMWYSFTPEQVSKRHARVVKKSCASGILLDMFCGLGGDLLYQSTSLFCIGTDILETRLHEAVRLRHELSLPSPARADFVLCDSMSKRSCFRDHSFDVVYLSPPWGHEGILNRKKFPVFGYRRLDQLLVNGKTVFRRALSLVNKSTCNIAYYLPRGISKSEVEYLGTLTNSGTIAIDVHEAYDPDDETSQPTERYKVRALTVYYGQLAFNVV